MIKQTMYYINGIVDCTTIETTHEGKPMFKAYDTEEQATEQAEQWREDVGQNIARIIINE